jgi:citrate lyase subunit beta / citryl-CoA lyase
VKLRTLLFAPGDSPRKIAKALAAGADGTILDLEDSVGPAGKDAARDGVAATLAGLDRGDVLIRINARTTPWHLPDLAAAVKARPAAIVLPKCTGPADLSVLDHQIAALEAAYGLPQGRIAILPLVTETAASIHGLDYRGVSPRLLGLAFGAEDIAGDLGVAPRNGAGLYSAPVMHARAMMLLAATAAGVPAIDTPFTDPRDGAGLERESRAAAEDGFSGKFCIHPDQIEPVRRAFAPGPERVAWARAVRDAFAAAPEAGVLTLEGRMIEAMHLRLARKILAQADAGGEPA